MNPRERILAVAAGAVVAGLALWWLLDRAVLGPAADLEARAAQLQGDIEALDLANYRRGNYVRDIRELAGRTFNTDEMRASEALRAHLVELLHRSGLGAEGLSLKPFSGTPERGVYREIGWFIRARGRLEHVVNFLYLLDRDAYLHRTDAVSVSPVARSLDMDLQVRYSSLVLTPPKAKKVDGKPMMTLETNTVAGMLDEVPLDDEARQAYAVITERDLFRPYVKRVERPAPPPQVVHSPPPSRPTPSPSSPPPAAPDDRFRVVGLPSWGEDQDVYVLDSSTKETNRYGPGDPLAGGEIVLVDYRALPLPDKPEILSGSRVILKIGPDYWAVELGRSLAEKYLVKRSRLPEALRAEPAPAEGAARVAAPVSE